MPEIFNIQISTHVDLGRVEGLLSLSLNFKHDIMLRLLYYVLAVNQLEIEPCQTRRWSHRKPNCYGCRNKTTKNCLKIGA